MFYGSGEGSLEQGNGRLFWIQENEVFGGGSFTPTQSHLQCACIFASFRFILHTDCFQRREEADGFVWNRWLVWCFNCPSLPTSTRSPLAGRLTWGSVDISQHADLGSGPFRGLSFPGNRNFTTSTVSLGVLLLEAVEPRESSKSTCQLLQVR